MQASLKHAHKIARGEFAKGRLASKAQAGCRTQRRWLVIVGAAQVIAAVGAHQLAAMAGEPVAAGGAYLAMMIDRLRLSGASCTTL